MASAQHGVYIHTSICIYTHVYVSTIDISYYTHSLHTAACDLIAQACGCEMFLKPPPLEEGPKSVKQLRAEERALRDGGEYVPHSHTHICICIGLYR